MPEEDTSWLAEAIVDFLRGPCYINPLMGFIDEKCLIFTPEDENKFEYTQAHEEFKQLVDQMLTEFLQELGVSAETFYETMAKAQGEDKLSEFVIQTILTVDDFLMFKAMMVKRNIDLTTQVLDAVEASHKKLHEPPAAVPASATGGSKAAGVTDESLREAMAASEELARQMEERDRLVRTMRALQLEDEDEALVAALAASLRDQAAADRELADLEAAIALSLALEEERRRMAVAAAASAGGAASAAPAAKAPAKAAAATAPEATVKASPPATPVKPAAAPAPAASAAATSGTPAAAAAAAPAASKSSGSTIGPLPPVKQPVMPSGAPPPASSSSGRFVPTPINAPTSASAAKPEPITGPALVHSGSVRNRGLGFKTDCTTSAADLQAIRDAARQAADSQKKILGPGQVDEASAWLREAKLKLIAQKKAEREAELAEYKAQRAAGGGQGGKVPAGGQAGGQGGQGDALEAKRAALREQLASNMKQNLITKTSGQ